MRQGPGWVIEPMCDSDALAVGRLYRDSIPEAIFARLGARFTARFLRWVSQQEHSGVWVARDKDGAVLGVVAGTLDRPRVYHTITRQHVVRISLSVLANLYRPSVAGWVARAMGQRVRPPIRPPDSRAQPPAELLLVAVEERAKGTGLAHRLVDHMESMFADWGFQGTYKILTLATNVRANTFYSKIGARLAAQSVTRGYLIHEYHKDMPTGAS